MLLKVILSLQSRGHDSDHELTRLSRSFLPYRKHHVPASGLISDTRTRKPYSSRSSDAKCSEPLILMPRRSMLRCPEPILVNPLRDELALDKSSISEILAYIHSRGHRQWSQTACVQISTLPPSKLCDLGELVTSPTPSVLP